MKLKNRAKLREPNVRTGLGSLIAKKVTNTKDLNVGPATLSNQGCLLASVKEDEDLNYFLSGI